MCRSVRQYGEGGMMAKVKKKGPVDRFDSASYEIKQEDDTGRVYWEGAGAADKEVSRLDYGEPLTMDPAHFPVGTRIDVNEPWDEKFYEKLFEEREARNEAWRKAHH
jgi:hypothetical protein